MVKMGRVSNSKVAAVSESNKHSVCLNLGFFLPQKSPLSAADLFGGRYYCTIHGFFYDLQFVAISLAT